jgi:hypothetical protein
VSRLLPPFDWDEQNDFDDLISDLVKTSTWRSRALSPIPHDFES